MSGKIVTGAPDLTPGFYGKLPALGDFVKRRLPGSFVSAWDGWLQGCVASSKAHLGEHWLEIYLSSPVWRFTLLPGIGGEQGWSGVMIPSVDRVGRYFPLTVAAPLPPAASVFTMLNASGWFAQAEDAALSALDDEDFSLDDFAQTVANLGPCYDQDNVSLPDTDVTTLRSGWQIPLQTVDRAGAALQGVSELLAKNRFGHFSLWWTSGSELIAPSLLVSPGLPDVDAYTGMLDGRWRDSGWHTIGGAADEELHSEDSMVDV
ncbi:MAG: type VI secretion system-associated protein TagF [Gammaproteobacteria bacterium]|nr:type VI secretion system-associated protein TagF [Gammaproteobacteria bacterium]